MSKSFLLGAGPGSCASGSYPDAAGTCQTLAWLNQSCKIDALPVDEASDFQRSFAWWKGQGFAVEEGHWDVASSGCTQTFYVPTTHAAYQAAWSAGKNVKTFKNSAGNWVYFVEPPVRRSWKPAPVVLAYAVPATGSKEDAIFANVPSSPCSQVEIWDDAQKKCVSPCEPGMVWNLATNQCIKPYVNPCKPDEIAVNGKCVKKSGVKFGSEGAPQLSPPAPARSQAVGQPHAAPLVRKERDTMKRNGSTPSRVGRPGGLFGALSTAPRVGAPRRARSIGAPGDVCFAYNGVASKIDANGKCFPPGLKEGSPCTATPGSSGWLDYDAKCTSVPGSTCFDAVGSPGIVAQEPGGGNFVCALSAPKDGDNCVLGDTASFAPKAGVFNGSLCQDPALKSSAFYASCLGTQVTDPATGATGTLDDVACLALASSFTYPSTASGQPFGSVVKDQALCLSGYAHDFAISGQTLKICLDKSAVPKEGDGCTAGPGLAGTYHSPYGILVCIANAGQPCANGGTIDSQGNCVQTAKEGGPCQDNAALPPGTIKNGLCVQVPGGPKAGDPCDSGGGPGSGTVTSGGNCLANAATVPAEAHCPAEFPFYDPAIGHCLKASGDMSKIWNPICEKKDVHGELLVWDPAKKLCEALTNTPGDACTAPAGPGLPGVPGIFDAKGACHPLATSTLSPPEESSSKLPWILLLGTLAFGAYHLSTMKKRA